MIELKYPWDCFEVKKISVEIGKYGIFIWGYEYYTSGIASVYRGAWTALGNAHRGDTTADQNFLKTWYF